jgi:hypothetical protein
MRNALVVIGLLIVTSCAAERRDGSPLVARVTEVTSFEQLAGQPQLASGARNRLAGAILRFEGDGTFIYELPDSRDDLFPIRGSYRRDGEVLVFEGASSSQFDPTNRGDAAVNGTLLLTNDPQIELRWGTSVITTATEYTGTARVRID